MSGDMVHTNGSAICVVTGATSGIGLEVARIMAAAGHRVIGLGRDPDRCVAAEETIRRENGCARVSFETADLSSRVGVRWAADRITCAVDHVDVLVNNAGTFSFFRRVTADSLEMQLAVNWLAGFALTGLLLPRLLAAPRARVVTVSSGSHFAGRMRWNDLQLRRGYNGLKAYDQSKLATVLFTKELARRLGPGAPLCTYAVDPGLVRTEIGSKGAGPVVRLVWKVRTRNGIPAQRAALSVCYCALAPEAAARTGLYWKECAPVAASRRAEDELDALKLWEIGQSLSAVRYL